MFRPAVDIFRFSQTIKISLYNLCEGVLIERSLSINPLFALVSNVNSLYKNNEEVFSMIPHFLNLVSELSYGRHNLDTRCEDSVIKQVRNTDSWPHCIRCTENATAC
jgi:hypothetical protein